MTTVLLESTCVISGEDCQRNLASALARNLPRCIEEPARPGALAIVGGAPSVSEHLDELRTWPGQIWAVNGAYDYLLDNGIVPHGFVGVDPLPGLAAYVRHAQPQTTFYLSGLLDPSVFDALAGHNITLWFPEQDTVKWPAGLWLVGGGTTALTRIPFLARMLGWRNMTVFGADSSFDDDRYCYGHGRYGDDSIAPIKQVICNGEGPFRTELCLLKQVSQFGIIAEHFGDQIAFRCGGLLDAYLRAPVTEAPQHDSP